MRITGLDGNASPEFPVGMPLFPQFELLLDLPKEASVKDFEIPADWVLPRTAPVTKHGA